VFKVGGGRVSRARQFSNAPLRCRYRMTPAHLFEEGRGNGATAASPTLAVAPSAIGANAAAPDPDAEQKENARHSRRPLPLRDSSSFALFVHSSARSNLLVRSR
jgi:hypothetical protein